MYFLILKKERYVWKNKWRRITEEKTCLAVSSTFYNRVQCEIEGLLLIYETFNKRHLHHDIKSRKSLRWKSLQRRSVTGCHMSAIMRSQKSNDDTVSLRLSVWFAYIKLWTIQKSDLVAKLVLTVILGSCEPYGNFYGLLAKFEKSSKLRYF